MEVKKSLKWFACQETLPFTTPSSDPRSYQFQLRRQDSQPNKRKPHRSRTKPTVPNTHPALYLETTGLSPQAWHQEVAQRDVVQGALATGKGCALQRTKPSCGASPFSPAPLLQPPSALPVARAAVSAPTTCPGQVCHLPSHSSLHACPCARVLGSPHPAGMGVGPVESGHVLMCSPRWEAGIQDAGYWLRVQSARGTDAAPCLHRGAPHLPCSSLQDVAPDAPARWSETLRHFLAAIPSPSSGASETPGARSHSSHGWMDGRTLVIDTPWLPQDRVGAQLRPRGCPNHEMAAGRISRVVAIAAVTTATSRLRSPSVGLGLCEVPVLLSGGRHSLGSAGEGADWRVIPHPELARMACGTVAPLHPLRGRTLRSPPIVSSLVVHNGRPELAAGTSGGAGYSQR